MVSLERCVKWVEWVDNTVHSTFKLSKKSDRIHNSLIFFRHRNENLTYFNFSSHEKILKFDIFRFINENLSFPLYTPVLSFTYSPVAKYITNEACN